MKNFNRLYWQKILLPHYHKFVEFTEKSFNKMQLCKDLILNDSVEVDIKAKTYANIVHDIFCGYAKDYFNGIDGYVAGEIDGVFGIYLKEKCFIRFNKLNHDGSISNHKSTQRDKFLNQIALDIFPNEVVYLNLGYKVDPFWDVIQDIHLTCWNNGKEWEMDVKEGTAIFEQISFDLENEILSASAIESVEEKRTALRGPKTDKENGNERKSV